jgi:HK97 family phage major capsid protein
MCFADAKNQLESAKFLKGLGHTSHEPQGLIAAGGATAVTSTATTAVFAVADLMNLELALSPRYRPNATIVGNKATFQKVRQFASNGVNIWVQLQGAVPPELIGYPALEWSATTRPRRRRAARSSRSATSPTSPSWTGPA